MNCAQVSKLQFAYCDNEVYAQTRLELEKHLEECPECQRMIDYAARETQALGYDEDIPELRQNFSHDIVRQIAHKESPNKAAILTDQKRLRSITRNNIFAACLAAVLLCSWVLIPEVRDKIVGTFNASQQLLTDNKADSKIEEGKLALVGTENAKKEAANESTQLVDSAPLKQSLSKLFAPDYNVTYPRKLAGRSIAMDKSTSTAKNSGIISVPLYQPAYLPNGYRLREVIPDGAGNCTLAYKNDQGGFLNLIVLMMGKDAANVSVPIIAEADNLINDGPPETMMKSTAAPTAADQTAGSDTGAESTAGSNPAYGSTASNIVESNVADAPTAVIWTAKKDDELYCLELSGSLSAEELGKIAASVKAP
ncbi:MAG: anti-sigma factor family protein [Ignavibacteriales bacterium]